MHFPVSLPQLARSLARTLGVQLSQEPASRLIRRTALEQWKLLALATASNLGRAALEGASLATVFLAVDLLSQGSGGQVNWQTKPLISGLPALVAWLEDLEPTELFVGLSWPRRCCSFSTASAWAGSRPAAGGASVG